MTAPNESSIFKLASGREISYCISRSKDDSDRPLLLLSNSLCAPFASWDLIVERLLRRGADIIRYDQPGHGRSGSPEGLQTTFEGLADDVAQLLQSLSITRLDAWIGVSMGAATGVYFATRYPGFVRKLIICDTISCSPENAGAADVFKTRSEIAISEGSMTGLVEQTIDRWFSASWKEQNREELSRVRSIMQNTSVEGFVTCCSALSNNRFDIRPLAADLGACVEEVSFVVGENDANLPQSMSELRDSVAGGLEQSRTPESDIKLHIITNAGHVCYLDNPQDFLGTISSVLGLDHGRGAAL